MKKINLTISFLILFSIVLTAKEKAKVPPQWVSEGIAYQIFFRSFTNEGTIKAAQEKLPKIVDLGATIVYLSPIMLADTSMNKKYWSPRQQAYPGNNPRNPYRAMDYTKLDPEYGCDEDLIQFIKEAHKLGLKVLMDLVYLHTGPGNVLMSDKNNYKLDENGDLKLNNWNFPELNFENKNLREYLIKNMESWLLKFGFDGFRCDVSGSIPTDFWEEARIRIESLNPNIAFLAESNTPDEMLKAFDFTYSFPWYFTLIKVVKKGEPASMLREVYVKQKNDFPDNTVFLRFSDNHDLERTICAFSEPGSRAVNVLNFMIDGIPFIYNGQEIGDAAPIAIYSNYPILWEAQGMPEKTELREWYKKLISIRKNELILEKGETIWRTTNQPESILAFSRKMGDKEIFTIINLSNRALTVKLLQTDLNVEFEECLIDFGCEINKNIFSLAGYGYYVGEIKN